MPIYPRHPYPGASNDEARRLRNNAVEAFKRDIRQARDLLRTGRPKDVARAQAILSRLLGEP